MKVTINKNEILSVLAKIQGLAGRKTNLAITTNILIQTEDAGISISATDLETGFEGVYPASVETQGTIAINARKFYEIVRDFPSEDIFLNEIENHWIEIGNQNVEYHIVGLNPDDFPEIPKIEAVDFFEIDSAALAKMIERTVIVSGASDDNRAHIIGVYAERLELDDQKVFRLVATDGSRLSKADFIFDKAFELPPGSSVLIPKKGLVEVAKFLDSEANVQIGIKDNNFIVKKEKETLIIRLLEGDFPQYGDIVLKTDGNDIQLDRQLFLMMLRRMSILSSEEYKGVIFHFNKDKLMINSTNPDIGESKEDMEIAYQGDPLEVMYNPKFFIDTLSVLHEDNIILNIVDEEKPCKIEGEKDKSYLSVIMPMRI
ncbi:MAG: DNA polymerase III subunit beta [Desulfobacterales bacterium]|nr:DNA polymerase III subunit beta [Desulfobacterales bacterium]